MGKKGQVSNEGMSGKFGFVWSVRLKIHNHDYITSSGRGYVVSAGRGYVVSDKGRYRAARAAKKKLWFILRFRP